MNTDLVYSFLRDIKEHNSREWMAQNRERYLAARSEYEALIQRVLTLLCTLDSTLTTCTVRDALFRFSRDTRFSPDKAPYKRHFGAYLSAWGRKSFMGGYYVHVQPGNSFLAVGAYCLATPLLTACRNEIMANSEQWRQAVENEQFVAHFGTAAETAAESSGDPYDEVMAPHGFGSMFLKTCPQGFPKESPLLPYLRMKDYSCWQTIPDTFFAGDWEMPLLDTFRAAQPMLRFINAVLVDYL